MRSSAIACLFLAASACAHAEIPYDLSRIPTPSVPVHAKKVALLPVIDARRGEDLSDGAEVFVYRGVDYAHTRLEELRGEPLHRITELLAAHLAKARVFDQVILVLDPSQAPEADLILRAEVRRIRGYVEANAPPEKSARPKNERFVLAEFFLANVELSDAAVPENIYFRSDAGWSIDEPRLYPAAVAEPWSILGEAASHAMDDLLQELARADLSGATVIKKEVRLSTAAELTAPEGWSLTQTATSAPEGWRGRSTCTELCFQQKQTLRFNRTLGPYRPAVKLWTCPSDQRLSYNPLSEFPARFLGTHTDGTLWFIHTLGESNWPKAVEELTARLQLIPPGKKHTFEIGG
jgi:hypothetical protein